MPLHAMCQFIDGKGLKQNVFHTDKRPVMIIIPAVAGIPAAVFLMGAFPAGAVIFGEVPAEDFKAVLPDIGEPVFEDIALNGFLSSFDIQTGADIPVCHDGSGIDAGIALPVPVPDFSLIVNPEIMAAPIA